MKTGTVYFVGAGPGDPALITRRGASLLAQADCIIYDRLVDPALLKLAGAGCRRIYVGKEADEGGASQSRINRMLLQEARKNRSVIRLKGGDPTVFGRISEEMGELLKAKVPFEIVPGVSSVWAAAAVAGIPLTDRRFSSSVAIVAGHAAKGKNKRIRWAALAKGADTLVILMGRAALPEIGWALRRGGRRGTTPVALIRWATTPEQEVLFTDLAHLTADLQKRPSFGPPVVAVIGEVVRLAHKIGKNKNRVAYKTLKNKKILVTRPQSDSREITKRLRSLGARCVHLPTISIRPAKLSAEAKRELIQKLPSYDWLLFTSHHGVDALDQILRSSGTRLARVKAKICAIGPRTAESVKAAGRKPDLIPVNFSKKGIAAELRKIPVAGRRILIPRSNLGLRDEFSESLRGRGARVDEIVLYETVTPAIPAARLKKALAHLDVAAFTSASTVRGFFEALKKAKLSPKTAFNGAAIVAIGPSTAQVLEENGIRRYRIPTPTGNWTLDGLVDAIVAEVNR